MCSTRSVAVTPSRNAPVRCTPDHFRREEINRLTEHARFRLDAADAPADDAEAVDHRRVRIGADERVRIKDRVAIAFADNTPFARYSRFT